MTEILAFGHQIELDFELKLTTLTLKALVQMNMVCTNFKLDCNVNVKTLKAINSVRVVNPTWVEEECHFRCRS